jgi:hypothetical protein
MNELGYFLEDIQIARRAYEQRLALATQHQNKVVSVAS